MIDKIIYGDITDPSNKACHFIIGMNGHLESLKGIGRKSVEKLSAVYPVKLGSVVSIPYVGKGDTFPRTLHMIICHYLRRGGWDDAERCIRYGMDSLRQNYGDTEKFSMVDIGTGEKGLRFGANRAAIHKAMATSDLMVDLYKYDHAEETVLNQVVRLPLRHYRISNGHTLETGIHA